MCSLVFLELNHGVFRLVGSLEKSSFGNRPPCHSPVRIQWVDRSDVDCPKFGGSSRGGGCCVGSCVAWVGNWCWSMWLGRGV